MVGQGFVGGTVVSGFGGGAVREWTRVRNYGYVVFFCLWTGVHTRLKDRRKHTSLSTKVRLKKTPMDKALVLFLLREK